MQNSPTVHRGRLRSRPVGGDRKRLHQGQASDAQGNVQKNYDLKRKPFVQNDLKPLYGLRSEDIHFLADLVERKEISVKGSKATKGDKVARLPSLQAAGNRERLMWVMKNELMNHFKKFELPSRKSTYVMYSCTQGLGRLCQGEVHYSCGAGELVG